MCVYEICLLIEHCANQYYPAIMAAKEAACSEVDAFLSPSVTLAIATAEVTLAACSARVINSLACTFVTHRALC